MTQATDMTAKKTDGEPVGVALDPKALEYAWHTLRAMHPGEPELSDAAFIIRAYLDEAAAGDIPTFARAAILLHSQAAQIAALTQELELARGGVRNLLTLNERGSKALTAARAEIERLKGALEPFARYFDGGMDFDNAGEPLPDDQGVGWIYLKYADFRRARAALADKEASPKASEVYDTLQAEAAEQRAQGREGGL